MGSFGSNVTFGYNPISYNSLLLVLGFSVGRFILIEFFLSIFKVGFTYSGLNSIDLDISYDFENSLIISNGSFIISSSLF